MNYQNVKFIKSAADPSGFIPYGLPQVVFAGKSNVGKSSVINKVLNWKNFARVGGTPGKTIHVNYFLIDEKAYFVDLPGYGYARKSETEKVRWRTLMEDFFGQPESITLGILIVDSRHKPTADDVVMAEWFKFTGRPMVIVANKIDKLTKTELASCADMIRETLNLRPEVKIIPFSAVKGTNRGMLISEIEKYAK